MKTIPVNATTDNLADFALASSVSELRTLHPVPGSVAILLGTNTPGDGGGALYYWDAANGATDDAANYIGCNLLPVGRWRPLVGLKGQSANANNYWAARQSPRPIVQPPVTATPTVTYANANPGTTGTSIPAYDRTNSRVDPRFTYLGGTPYQSGPVTPDYDYVTGGVYPNVPVSPGNLSVEWISNAPILTIPYKRSQLGALRVLVDSGSGFVEVAATGSGIVGTAQQGTSSTIRLASGASATAGIYNRQKVMITSGTGAGQTPRLVTAYNGSTKDATVVPDWVTPPDNTSIYALSLIAAPWNSGSDAGTLNYITLDWSGDATLRRYRIDLSGFAFTGLRVPSAAYLVAPTVKSSRPSCFYIADSGGKGTGAEAEWNAMSGTLCNLMGWELYNLSIGGTGFLNDGAGLLFGDRVAPPVNAWKITIKNGSAGTYTINQNGLTTAAIAYGANSATVQAAVDLTFGTGAFKAVSYGFNTITWVLLIGRGANAAISSPLTVDLSGVTATTKGYAQYLGDIAENLPTDGNGNAQPFFIVFAGGHNDTTATSASYTAALLQSTCAALFAKLQAMYPQATIIVLGNWFVFGTAAASVLAANLAQYNAANVALPKLNGRVPFVDSLGNVSGQPVWFTGSTDISTPSGSAQSDYVVWTDRVHMAREGHVIRGSRDAAEIAHLLNLQ